MTQKPRMLPVVEFVLLQAMLISLMAISTDMMLPALGQIATDLRLDQPSDAALIVSVLFFGFAVGQIFSGPLSDSFGRKPVIMAGLGVFLIGCLMALFSTSWTMMLVGRLLQGLGISAPRIAGLALVRDQYEGRAMARIMSFVITVFIVVPVVAPSLGQAVILVGNWRMIFAFILAQGIVAAIWFYVRQPETLMPEDRRGFSVGEVTRGAVMALSYRRTLGYTLVTGATMGGLLAYLSSAQLIFQITYDAGAAFPLYFGAGALSVGVASVTNARIVMRLGMRLLAWRALLVSTAASALFLSWAVLHNGVPPFWSFMAWLIVIFFCLGMSLGNLNSLALEPLGKLAGIGAAIVGALSTFIGLPVGWIAAEAYAGGVGPLAVVFTGTGLASVALIWWTERGDVSPKSATNLG